MRSRVHASTFLLLIGLVLLLSACAPKASERVEGTVLDAAGKPLDKVRVFNCGDGLAMIETRTATDGHFFLQGFGTGRVWLFAQKEGYRFAALCPAAGASDNRLTLAESREPPKAQAAASEPIPLERQQQLAHRLLEKLWADCSGDNRCYWVTRAMGRIDPELALRWAGEKKRDECVALIRAAMAEQVAEKDLDEALGLVAQSGPDGLTSLIRLARRYAATDPAKAIRCVEELVVGARAVDQPWRAGCLAQAGGLAIRLGKMDTGRKLLDEASQAAGKFGSEAAKLGSEREHAAARGMVAEAWPPAI